MDAEEIKGMRMDRYRERIKECYDILDGLVPPGGMYREHDEAKRALKALMRLAEGSE